MMTLPVRNEHADEGEEKIQNLRRGSLKAIFYIAFLAVLLSVLDFIFNPPTIIIDDQEVPLLPFLEPYENIIGMIQPYLIYIQAVVVFVLGYLAVNAASGLVYTYLRRITDRSTAAAIRTVTRISGLALLLSVASSIFNVGSAVALTVGSFGGLVVGFATQTILSHVVAGVFLLLTRPFTYGDTVTVSGQTGVVKEIRLMHLVLETEDGTKDILIPSGTVVTQIIQKKKQPATRRPIKTRLILGSPPSSVAVDSTITFTGKLVEAASGRPVSGVTVKIFEKDVGQNELLASGTTGSDGKFAIRWTAKKMDRWDKTIEIFARFEGNRYHSRSESKQYVVALEGRMNP